LDRRQDGELTVGHSSKSCGRRVERTWNGNAGGGRGKAGGMRMPKHWLKLLVLLMAFSVAPASARQSPATLVAQPAVVAWSDHSITCPHERARLAAVLEKLGTTPITLTDRVPPDAPLLGRGSTLFTP
jgi:hypothetical protein